MTHTESPARSLPTQFVTGATARPVNHRTRFCTVTGWHAYRDITPAMRGVIFSARDGAGLVKCSPSKRTEDALLAMGLIEPQGNLFRLTLHGEIAWVELDEL